jgi:peroxiredoxin
LEPNTPTPAATAPRGIQRDIAVIVVIVVVVLAMLFAGKYLKRTSAPSVSAAGSVSGLPAPDFALKDVNGHAFRLSDLRGKAVVLNFWATWCPPCKIEIPWFVDLQKQYGPEGLQIVGVDMDDNAKPEEIAAFVKNMSINYTVLMGNDQVGDQYGGVQALPTTFYIGRDGKLVSRVYGLVSHSEVESNIQAALKQGAAVATNER